MSVASKNLFALLGNDEEDDTPKAPVKTVDKSVPRTTKRNGEPQAPAQPAGTTGGARRGPGGNEGAFRDRNVGSSSNQRKNTDEPSRGGARGGRGARREGGRGGRFPRERDDRHTKGHVTGSEKQAAQSWGATEGEAEQKDEQAGEAIAQSELKDAAAEDAEDATPAEPEDKSVSYVDYLAQQAEKKLALGGGLEIRKPNEGSKTDKKWANAKAIDKDEGDDDLFSATGGKTKRERERKVKQVVDIDQRYVEPPASGGRGGARGGRGDGRGRGGARGDGGFRGGARGDRAEGRGRGGEGRGGRGRGDGFRGGRPAGPPGGRENNASINTKDESAFPSLGA